jgi:histidinol-phosphate aminotransferase
MTRALAHIARMAPYALADLKAGQSRPMISLSQNESLRAPSPRAVQAATDALAGAMLYPDPNWAELRSALADHFGISSDGILCGNGSLDLIGAIARVYSGPARAVLAPAHAYPFFRTAALMADARFDTAPEQNATVSVDALLAGVQPDTGVVFVANPGNPTGTRIPKSDLERLRAGLRGDILLVIDEAYGEFSDHLDAPCFDMVQGDNTIVLRTFSKAYGMAGFRVGWGLFPTEIAQELRKVMNPNNVAAATQAAAVAALGDQGYMRETCAQTVHLRDAAITTLRSAGFDVFQSHTNFILIDLGSAEAAQDADAFLNAAGLILRRQNAAGLPHALRMTIGPKAALSKAIDRLTLWKRNR